MAFVHFGIHTEFSITDSIVRIKALVKAAKADNQLALAISDLSNLYATVKFYKACLMPVSSQLLALKSGLK